MKTNFSWFFLFFLLFSNVQIFAQAKSAQSTLKKVELNSNIRKDKFSKTEKQNLQLPQKGAQSAKDEFQKGNSGLSQHLSGKNDSPTQNNNSTKDNSPFDAVKGKKEDTSKRDAYSKHFDNGDGSFTAIIGSGPVHYEKNGQFLDINHNIVPQMDATYPYVNTTNLFESYFGATSHTGIKNKTAEGEVKEFLNTQMYWEVNGQNVGILQSSNVPFSSENEKGYYYNVYGDIDVEFIISAGNRKLNYIIPDMQALGNVPSGADYLVFTEDVVLPFGWSSQLTDRGIMIKDQLGKNVFLYKSPISTDASNEISSRTSNTLYETNQIGNTLTIKTKVKTDWLLSNERVFPVMVDPNATIYVNNADWWTGRQETTNTGNLHVNNTLQVGRNSNSGGARYFDSYMRFDLSSIPFGYTVNSAVVNLNRNGGSASNFGNVYITNCMDYTIPPGTFNIMGSVNTALSAAITGLGFNGWKPISLNTNGNQYVEYYLGSNVNFAIYGDGSGLASRSVTFRPHTHVDRPYLVIDYTICDPISAFADEPVICEGGSTDLHVSSLGSYTYQWYEDYDALNNTGTLIGSGNSITVTPTESTLYAVVSSCGRYEFVSVALVPLPTLITQSPIEVNNCETDDIIHELTMTGGLIPSEALVETFNPDSAIPWLVQTTVYGGAGTAFARWGLYNSGATFYSNDNTDFAMVDSNDYGNFTMESSLISPTFSLADYSAPINLSFYHYYEPYSGQTGTVEVSTDLGDTWTDIQTYTSLQGSATGFVNANLNLNAYAGEPAVQVRFRFNATWGWYWAIDNVTVTGTPNPTEVTWSPIAGLYTDSNATTAYNGENLTTVYAMPENTTTYTVTAESSVGCETTAEVDIIGGISIWDGAQWVNSVAPTDDRKVVFRGDYSSSADLEACSVLVESGDVLINADHSLIVNNRITVNNAQGSLTIDSDANLLQIDPGAVNTGEITVRRSATVPSNQYNFWASPVVGQELYDLYPNIPNNRVMTYNTWDDFYTIIPNNPSNPPEFQFGIGYSIKGPTSNKPATPSGGTAVLAEFIGVPQNESLTATENRIEVETYDSGDNFNLIGNPFPSNLDLVEMYDATDVLLTGNANKFETPTAYFWDNVGNTEMTQQGSNYNQSNFAYYQMASQMGNAAPCTAIEPNTCEGGSGKKPNGIVKPGQGFIVNIAEGETFLTVNNQMRTIETLKGGDEAVYYKNGMLPEANDTHKREDKFWLEMINQVGLRIQTSVGYFVAAENTFDRFDAEIMSESVSDNIYTLSNDAVKLAINGREGIFSDEDVIPLGVKFFVNGKYRIQLEDTKGIFVHYQKIYLKDKHLGIIHNLSEDGPYEIDGIAGEYIDRFEIVFKDGNSEEEPVLTAASQVNIQKIDKQILITSSKDKIQEVEIFNLAGWSVYKKTGINAHEFRIPVKSFEHQIILVKVRTESGEIVTKKLVN